MKRIIVKPHGTTHYAAHCDICEWGACMFTSETPSEDAVRKATRSHVLKTGHTVTIEAAKSTQYVSENKEADRPNL